MVGPVHRSACGVCCRVAHTTYRSSHMVVQELRVPPCRWCGRAQDALVFDRVNETLMADCAKHRDGADIILDSHDLVCLGVPVRFMEAGGAS